MGDHTPRGTTGPGYDDNQSDPHKNHNHPDHSVEPDNQNTGSSGTSHGEGGKGHNDQR